MFCLDAIFCAHYILRNSKDMFCFGKQMLEKISQINVSFLITANHSASPKDQSTNTDMPDNEISYNDKPKPKRTDNETPQVPPILTSACNKTTAKAKGKRD